MIDSAAVASSFPIFQNQTLSSSLRPILPWHLCPRLRAARRSLVFVSPFVVVFSSSCSLLKVGSVIRGVQISREQPPNSTPTSRINEPFCASRNDRQLAPSSITDDPQTPTEHTKARHRNEVANHQSEDEDYDSEADEVGSFEDHIDDLFATEEVKEDGVRKGSELSVKEAIALPSNTKIILPFNKELQPIGQAAGLLIGSLGADYFHFSICEECWKHVNKAKKEYAYDMVKRVFQYEDDAREKIKQDIMKRIEKNWKDTRSNLYHKFHESTRTFEKNVKHHPSEIEENNWK
ncbi:hypothetical protein Ahy_A07g032580 [Arachis hypogaea]|uniref:Uncharacterized protein n=1 Tax=Arachis hypogaea TaxID=3818 RepID=A0A445C737_ARAHY|nr:hypothetical protein Ahy_A07g032580 [Arachis hypogaea]